MAMTKKDYEAVAEMLRIERHCAAQYETREVAGAVEHIAVELAAVFARLNPRFNTRKFLYAADPARFSDSTLSRSAK